jgi:hypothetical protein
MIAGAMIVTRKANFVPIVFLRTIMSRYRLRYIIEHLEIMYEG